MYPCLQRAFYRFRTKVVTEQNRLPVRARTVATQHRDIKPGPTCDAAPPAQAAGPGPTTRVATTTVLYRLSYPVRGRGLGLWSSTGNTVTTVPIDEQVHSGQCVSGNEGNHLNNTQVAESQMTQMDATETSETLRTFKVHSVSILSMIRGGSETLNAKLHRVFFGSLIHPLMPISTFNLCLLFGFVCSLRFLFVFSVPFVSEVVHHHRI